MSASVFAGVDVKPVIYQLVVRLFGNTNETRAHAGALEQNGVGRFADIDDRAIDAIRRLGVTDIWLTGVLRQATLTDYTAYGMPADSPDAVKGRAGSFYAIRDYYDVCPDYALEPSARMQEFEALVDRIHASGLGVLIDLVPNHVARGYGSVVDPERDFGRGDDPSRFFDRNNSFFYLVEPAGQRLTLARPPGWNPEGVVFQEAYAREDGAPGRIPKATGNNVTSPNPGATDWYETIKLNYGYNFAAPEESSLGEPIPRTWSRVDDILAYWQQKGVDGFRVDFAHWVPPEAWRYLLAQVKKRNPKTLLIAEAYENLPGLLEAGFDAVYHDAAYDLLKSIYLGRNDLDDLDAMLGAFPDSLRGRYAHYLENHDERRIASPLVHGAEPDASGFGSAAAGPHLAPLLYLYGDGPILFYNGQEVGEPAALAEGFGGDDGRTTIFDYWSMPEFAKWVHGGRFDGGGLDAGQRALRQYYCDLLALCQAPEVRGKGYWGLRSFNRASPSGPSGANEWLFAYARFSARAGSLLVVVTNFTPGQDATGRIRLPEALVEAAGLPNGPLSIRRILGKNGAADERIGMTNRASIAIEGFPVRIENQSSTVYRISA